MADLTYPDVSSDPSGGAPSGLPRIKVASPPVRTYDPKTLAPVRLPVFTASGDGFLTVTFTIITEDAGFSTADDGSFSPTLMLNGEVTALNADLGEVWLKPADGSQNTIAYTVEIKNDEGDESSVGDPLEVQNVNLEKEGVAATASVTIAGTSGSIQLKVNSTAISGVVPYTGSLSQTTVKLVESINGYDGVPHFKATKTGDSTIKLEAPLGVGGALNNIEVTAIATGTMSINGPAKIGGGVTQVKQEETLFDKGVDALGKVLPTIGLGLVTGLALGGTAKAQVEVNVTTEEETPEVAVVYDGVLIPVPVGYTPPTLTDANVFIAGSFPASWDYVSFQNEVWTSNPAWCLLAFIRNKLWGCGNLMLFTDEQLLRFHQQIYEAAKYCDEMLPGTPNPIPRYSLNTVISNMTKIEAIDAIASCMNARVIYTDDGYQLMQDRPGLPVKHIVTNANVLGGDFKFTGGDLRAKFNYVDVQYNNPAKYYNLETIYGIDPISVKNEGEKRTLISAFGCTEEAQAKRKANYVMANEQANPLILNYVANMDHIDLIAGDIIAAINNTGIKALGDKKAGGMIVQAISPSLVVLDRPITMEPGGYLHINTDDGIESRVVSNVTVADGRSTVTLGTPFSQLPEQNCIWAYHQEDLNPVLYMIVSIAERSGTSTYDVSAIKYDTYKFSLVDEL